MIYKQNTAIAARGPEEQKLKELLLPGCSP
ncbi:hypothetical protein PATA110616_15945 [Paenibacillus tarimensis]